jgi:hypothetical protein
MRVRVLPTIEPKTREPANIPGVCITYGKHPSPWSAASARSTVPLRKKPEGDVRAKLQCRSEQQEPIRNN